MLALSVPDVGENRTVFMRCYAICVLILLQIVICGERKLYADSKPVVKIGIATAKEIYKVGEPILLRCELHNISGVKVFLPPLQIVDVTFSLYNGDTEVTPFGRPCMTFYGPDEQGIISLDPNQTIMFKRTLDRSAYAMPTEPGCYRLCIHYSNYTRSLDNIELWVGNTTSCATLRLSK
jgi:hypothetical protein